MKRTLLAGLAILLFGSVAMAGTVLATGAGWCESIGECNNISILGINNTFAGEEGADYQDWFAFTLPNTAITSASISIWNDSQNYTENASALYNLYEAASITYGGINSGAILGSISASAADTGVSQYITINLNAAGLADLNANLGGQIILGGAVTGVSFGDPEVDFFGYTDGTPAAYLNINATTTPEPGSAMLLGMGLLGLAGMVRRKLGV